MLWTRIIIRVLLALIISIIFIVEYAEVYFTNDIDGNSSVRWYYIVNGLFIFICVGIMLVNVIATLRAKFIKSKQQLPFSIIIAADSSKFKTVDSPIVTFIFWLDVLLTILLPITTGFLYVSIEISSSSTQNLTKISISSNAHVKSLDVLFLLIILPALLGNVMFRVHRNLIFISWLICISFYIAMMYSDVRNVLLITFLSFYAMICSLSVRPELKGTSKVKAATTDTAPAPLKRDMSLLQLIQDDHNDEKPVAINPIEWRNFTANVAHDLRSVRSPFDCFLKCF